MKKIKLGLASLATFESIKPPYNLREPSVEENLNLGLELLDTAGANKVDIALLPESFPYAGIDGNNIGKLAENYPGKCVEAVARKAKEHKINVIAGFYLYIDGILRNVAILFDRQGKISGIYIKKYTTEGEISAGVVPGESQNIFETDVGRVGLAICFDLNWSDIWTSFEGKVDLVCWISAYEGGFPLQARAWLHHLPLATSVMSYHSKLFDISGKILTNTTRWNRMAFFDFNLDREIFHVDGQYSKIQEMQNKYGTKISIESFTEEHFFILQSLSADISVSEIIKNEGLVTYRDYIEQCTKIVEKNSK
jgi:predicted amidohydrolase